MLAGLLLVREWRILRERKMLAEDVELVCDTALRCMQMYSKELPLAIHERLLPDEVPGIEPPNWDESDHLAQVPSADEIEDTIAYFGGNTRQATFAMMQRRGFDPDNDDHVVLWEQQMHSSVN